MSNLSDRAQLHSELRQLLIGVLLLIFFCLMIYDIFEPTPAGTVEVCEYEATDTNVELLDPAYADSLHHNEDSYPVNTRM